MLLWENMATVKYDGAAQAIVFEAAREPPYVLSERYSGATAGDLAAHLEELRRKATLAPLDYEQVGRIALGLPHRTPR